MDPDPKEWREPEVVPSSSTRDIATSPENSAPPGRVKAARCAAAWTTFSAEERAVRVLIARALNAPDPEASALLDADRPLLVSEVKGVYSDPWAVAIVVRGSPPRGALLAVLNDVENIGRVDQLHLVEPGRSRCLASFDSSVKRLGADPCFVVSKYLRSRSYA